MPARPPGGSSAAATAEGRGRASQRGCAGPRACGLARRADAGASGSRCLAARAQQCGREGCCRGVHKSAADRHGTLIAFLRCHGEGAHSSSSAQGPAWPYRCSAAPPRRWHTPCLSWNERPHQWPVSQWYSPWEGLCGRRFSSPTPLPSSTRSASSPGVWWCASPARASSGRVVWGALC